MLIVGLKQNELVCLEMPGGKSGWINPVKISNGRVRLGFEFSSDVKIVREKAKVKTRKNPPEGVGEKHAIACP
jgi:hypothetical protein